MQFKVITSLVFGLALSGTMAAPATEDTQLEAREEQAKQDVQAADVKQDTQDTQVANACAPGTWPCNDVPNANPNWRQDGSDWRSRQNWRGNDNDWNRRQGWRHDDNDWKNRRPDWNGNNGWDRQPNWRGDNNWNRRPDWRGDNDWNRQPNNNRYRQRCGCTTNGNYHPDLGRDACNDLGRTWSNLQFDWQSSTCMDERGVGLEQNGFEAACQRVGQYSNYDQWSPQAIRAVCTRY